jgi:hypothetical protein
VCPDGTTVDTFRFVEACGSRCIIITTPKDNLWYYKDVPGFYIDDWLKLTKSYIDMILNRNLDTYQDDMEVYYGDNLSAWGVAHHIVKELYNAV